MFTNKLGTGNQNPFISRSAYVRKNKQCYIPRKEAQLVILIKCNMVARTMPVWMYEWFIYACITCARVWPVDQIIL